MGCCMSGILICTLYYYIRTMRVEVDLFTKKSLKALYFELVLEVKQCH